ncbi:MAG: type II secretion system F family protein [Planctomycetota bacterium]|jgi:type IV pilus assembly protein PilC
MKKLALAYHNLSVMLDAGMPILRSLETLVSSIDGKLQDAFAAVTQKVTSGQPIADAMAEHPKVFAPMDISLIRAADLSGNMADSLKMLSQWYEFSNRLKNIILSGMVLPVVLINITAVIAPLPLLFLHAINIPGYFAMMIRILALLYIPSAVIIAVLRLTPKTGILRRLLDALVLRIPILNKGIRCLAISRYCRAFYMLYKAGIPITQCAKTAPSMTGNIVIAELFEAGADSAQAGKLLFTGFSDRLPTEFLDLWRIGEETGELDSVTKRLADMYADTTEHLLTEFIKWLLKLAYFFVCAIMVIQIFKGYGMIMGR